MTDLAILYEHPQWFAPLFAALDRRGVDYVALKPDGDWDPTAPPPARVVFNRIAMSSFLRDGEHPIFHAMALLDHWQRGGARIVNDANVLAIDSSKARQLSLIASLGFGIPATRVVHRQADVVAAAQSLGTFPLVVKANIGGSGAGIVRFDSMDALRGAVADDGLPTSIDRVLLVQDYVPARDGVVTRIETLDRAFLYAIDIRGGGAFDLCPADACLVPGSGIAMTAAGPPPETIAAVEAIAQAMDLDVGGIEVMVDDRDGVLRFYDINALSNFVARPQEVLGYDPHEALVDYLIAVTEGSR